MEEYGERLSTTLKINYKYLAYLIPIVIIVTALLTYLFKDRLYILIGGPTCIFLALISTKGDQNNPEAFENGLKIALSGMWFRGFVPYRDIVYVCSFKFDSFIGKPVKGMVIIYNHLHTYPFFQNRIYSFSLLMDGKQTPFAAVIPCMKRNSINWLETYHPEKILKDYQDVLLLYDMWNSK